jgi:hypothetical protein
MIASVDNRGKGDRIMPVPEGGPKATWADIERAALRCPILAQAVELVRSGAATQGEALILVALQLSDQRAELMSREAERLKLEPIRSPIPE